MLLSSGCTVFGEVDKNDKTLSVVFGYFDVEDAPSWGGIDWVTIKQFKPKQNYYFCPVEDGLFYHIGIENSTAFQVDNFGRHTRWYSNTRYSYNFSSQGRNKTSKIIKKPGVYFLGSYKYKTIDSGSIFKKDKFDMVPIASPTEKELLTKLLDIMTNDGELSEYKYQIAMVKRRLRELK